MPMWHEAADELFAIKSEDLTVDQRLKRAEVMALLAIGQELSLIHHAGINPTYQADA